MVFDQQWQQVAKDWIQKRNVWSVELGGLGPGYEQAIQCLLFEGMALWPKGKLVPKPKGDEIPQEVEDHFAYVHKDLKLHLSGAQFYAARDTAYSFMTRGYAKVMNSIQSTDKDRLIQVNREFPRLPARTM